MHITPALLLCTLMLYTGASATAADRHAGTTGMTTPLINYDNPNELTEWLIINDGVMGGLSQSEIIASGNNTAIFRGELSLANNGGFSSVRTRPRDYDLAGYRGVRLHVKGDGKVYQFRIHAHNRIDDIAYRYRFETSKGEWQTIDLPFSAFVPVYRGRELPRQALSPARIEQLGFLIADEQAGPFSLEIESISAFR